MKVVYDDIPMDTKETENTEVDIVIAQEKNKWLQDDNIDEKDEAAKKLTHEDCKSSEIKGMG